MNPTPTPLASTAMEAAREIHETPYDLLELLKDDNGMTTTATIIQKHFEPLIDKVEGELAKEKQANLDHAEDWAFCGIPHDSVVAQGLVLRDQNRKLVADLTALRAALAAKEAALERIRLELAPEIEVLSLAQQNPWRHFKADMAEMEKRLSSLVYQASAALASRADKGGAT